MWQTIGWLMGVWLWLMVGVVQPAIASIHTYPEGANRVMVRSLQTLRDRQDQAWQLALFKRITGAQTESIHLRLVGFPGGATFQHPAPLRIASSTQGWMAPDVGTAAAGLPATVGEYDVLTVLTQLGSSPSLQLVLSLETGDRELVVPPFVVKEWRQILATSGR